MYKTRGRPDDSWNVDAADREKSIAETIQIRPLYKLPENENDKQQKIFIGARDEKARRRQHYEEFRETYQQRFQKSKEDAQNLKYKMKQELQQLLERKNENTHIINSTQTSFYNKLYVQNSQQPIIKVVKTVSVEAPNPKRTGAISLPPSQNKFTLLKNKIDDNSGNRSSLMKQLAETQDQIDEANSQLEQIQSILKQKQMRVNSDESTTATTNSNTNNEMNELYKKNPFARYALLQSSDQRLNVGKGEIGTPFPSGPCYNSNSLKHKQNKPIKSRVPSTKDIRTNKIKKTLNDVNVMIQKMQLKYFGKPHARYKSVSNYVKEPAPVSVLFENGQFPSEEYDKSNDNFDQKPHYSENSKRQESVESYTSCESQPSIGSRMEKIYQDSSSVSFILPPNSDYNSSKTISQHESRHNKKTSCCVNFKNDDDDDDDDGSSYDLTKKIKESLSSSEYLMKEFNSGRNFKNYSKTSSCSGKKSVHFSTAETQKSDDSNTKRREQVNSFIKSALRDSLYET